MTTEVAPQGDAVASAPSRPMTGIIYPPARIRDIIDMTADYVVEKGAKFLDLVRKNEAANPKFNFLQEADPYHAYFQFMMEEGRTGGATAKKEAKAKEDNERRSAEETRRRNIEEQAMKRTRALRNAGKTLAQIEWSERRKPTQPPEDLQYLCPAPSAYAETLDVIKLTARFAAGKGKDFTQQLQRREQANPLFDFLKPQHSMFAYFGKLVDQYTLIMLSEGKTAALEKLNADTGVEGSKNVLDRVLARSHFAQRKRELEEKEKENEEKERTQYQQIDWYSFAVVGTLEFAEDEVGEFPPPVKKSEVGGRAIEQERAKTAPKPVPTAGTNITAMQDDNDDMDMSDDDEAPPPPSSLPVVPIAEEVIIKDFDPKAKQSVAAAQPGEAMLVSPWTGELIPASQMEKHAKIITLDPRWEENRKRAEAEKSSDSVYSKNSTTHLMNLAKRRTDIFGTSASEVSVGQTVEDKQPGTQTSARQRLAQGGGDQLKVLQDMHTDLGLGKSMSGEANGAPGPSLAQPPQAQPAPPTSAPSKRGPLPPLSEVMPASAQQRRFGPSPTAPSRPQPGAASQQAQPPHSRVPNMPAPTRLGRPPMGSQGPGAPPAGGFRPPPPTGVPNNNVAAPPPANMKRPLPTGEVASNEPKRSKPADIASTLIDEKEFLAGNPGPVTLEVVVPKESNSAWGFNGQTLSFTLDLTDNVSVIKSKIAEAISIPANKQKLKETRLGFLKDGFSLAKYNVKSGMSLELSAKTRGGKK